MTNEEIDEIITDLEDGNALTINEINIIIEALEAYKIV